METKRSSPVQVHLRPFILLLITFSGLLALVFSGLGCSYCVPVGDTLCQLAGQWPIKEFTESGLQNPLPLEAAGTVVAYHGFGCAQSEKSGEEDVIKVEGSQDLPRYAMAGTVFLNGWRLKYLHKDHEVEGLGTLISNIRIEDKPDGTGKVLRWQAAGVLSDQNFDDAYRWCYHYTVVAWNPSILNLRIDQKDGSCDTNDPGEANFFSAKNDGTTTALSSFPTFLQNRDFIPGQTVAILPRGFGYRWSGGCEDHHLLQIAYNLDHSEIFIESEKKYKKKFTDLTPLPNPPSRVDTGFVSWETYSIFKDNKGRRGYEFGEMVSALAGNDVRVIQPPFSILPIEDHGRPCVWEGGAEAQEFIVDNVPFEYAIPMLTGWNLGYGQLIKGCNDHHVTEVGIWIDEWSYVKNPAAPTGTLRYKLSSSLHDKDNDPGHFFRQKVTILGLRPTAGVKPRD